MKATLDPEVAGTFTRDDYFDVLAELRATDPVHRYRDHSWLVTRYDDVKAISHDPVHFRSGGGVLMDDPMRKGRPIPGSILHMDPPEHAKWRKLTARSFTPRAVSGLEPRLREMASGVLDGLGREAEIDYVAEVSAPLPVLAIAELLGVDNADRADFRRWSDAVIGGSEEDREATLRSALELIDFLGAHADARRRQPTDDLVSELVEAKVDGCPLAPDAVVTYLMALLVAGNETTRHLLSGSMAALSAHPDQRRLLAQDRSAVPLAVEECLRWVTPIQVFARTATADVELGGQAVEAGDWVVLAYGSANRDEAVFGESASRFDVTRPVPPTHLSFGFGEHLCLGASLARLEARVFLEELLARFPDAEVTGPPTWVPSTLVRGMRSLPVVLR